jgi:hypothetical protein
MSQVTDTLGEKCPLCANKQRLVPLWFQENTETWIKCDICNVWCHASCLKLPSEECDRIDEYHCPECTRTHGPSICKIRYKLYVVNYHKICLNCFVTFFFNN